MKMSCPECGDDTKVMDTVGDGEQVARRRKCKSCGHIFYTLEKRKTIAKEIFRELEVAFKKRSEI